MSIRDEVGEVWLREQLEAYGLRDVEIKQSLVKWTVKADGSKIGQIESKSVASRDLHQVQRMLRLPIVVRVQIKRPTTKAFEGDDAEQQLRKAWDELNNELFESGRVMAKYMTELCQDLALEDRARAVGHSSDESARMTWLRRRLDHYETERLERTGVCFASNTRDVITSGVNSAFSKWKKSKFSDRMAEFTSGTVLLRNRSWRLERTSKPARWVVHFAVSSMRVVKKGSSRQQCRWHSVVVDTHGNGHVHATLRKMADGEIQTCDAKIVWERGNRCWAFRLTGMRQQPQRAGGDNVMAIRRSMAHPLEMTLADGSMFSVPGGAYLATKTALMARKSSMQSAQWVCGRGNSGRGRTKRLRARGHLAEAEENLTKTSIRQWWGNVAKIAKRRGVSTIVVEDFTVPADSDFLDQLPRELRRKVKRFPWGAVKSWGEWLCRKTGIRLVEVSAASTAHVCPLCGDETPENYLKAKQELLCAACNAHMPADMARGWNMLKRAGLLKSDEALRSRQRGWAKMMKRIAEMKYGKESDEDEAE